MELRRLGWAGLELRCEAQTLVIDTIGSAGAFAAFMGPEADPFLEPSQPPVAALLTHLHRDHADPEALAAWLAPGAPVLRPAATPAGSGQQRVLTGDTEAGLAASGLEQRVMEAGDTAQLGPFTVTATFASDGLGSPQVSWVVEAGGVRVFHGGDTLWHGHWWQIAEAHGPIAVACLPANGARLDYPFLQPAVDEPAVMTPRQAALAAKALGAPSLLAIHHNASFTHERFYRPFEGADEALAEGAREAGVALWLPEIGAWVDAGTIAPS